MQKFNVNFLNYYISVIQPNRCLKFPWKFRKFAFTWHILRGSSAAVCSCTLGAIRRKKGWSWVASAMLWAEQMDFFICRAGANDSEEYLYLPISTCQKRKRRNLKPREAFCCDMYCWQIQAFPCKDKAYVFLNCTLNNSYVVRHSQKLPLCKGLND